MAVISCHFLQNERKPNARTNYTSITVPCRIFTNHPASVAEGYFELMGFSLRFTLKLFGASIAALVHAFLPHLFEKTDSNTVASLHTRLTSRFNQ